MKWLRTTACAMTTIGIFAASWFLVVACDGAADRSAVQFWYGSMSLLAAVVGVIGILATGASVVYE